MYLSSEIFTNRPLVDLSEATKKKDLTTITPRIAVEFEGEKSFTELFEFFQQHQDLSTMDALVIGNWSQDYGLGGGVEEVIEVLMNKKADLPALKHLFIGDISQEESELSWVGLGDFAPLINHYPELEYFKARGGGNFFKTPISNSHLKTLILQTGGLSPNSIESLVKSDLPNIEHLELWLGTEYYEGPTTKQVKPLLKSTQFSKLNYLGLRNFYRADKLAKKLDNAPILATVEVLDLSLGSLGNKGAKALVKSDAITKLKKLDLHYHYITDNGLLEQLKAKVVELDISDKQKVYENDDYDDEDERYIYISE